MTKKLKSLTPFVILLLLIFIVYLTNLHQEFSLARVRTEQDTLLGFVKSYPVLAPLLFITVYIISVCLVIPDSTILSLLGGLVFPLPLAIIYIVFSEVVGGTIFFAIFRGVFGTTLTENEGSFLKTMRLKFSQHSASYLIFLRFSHILPFWLVNGLAAYFSVGYKTFIWTCFVGVLPLSIILADAGHSLSVLFHENPHVTLADIFTTQMKLALLALGVIALIPLIYQTFSERKKTK